MITEIFDKPTQVPKYELYVRDNTYMTADVGDIEIEIGNVKRWYDERDYSEDSPYYYRWNISFSKNGNYRLQNDGEVYETLINVFSVVDDIYHDTLKNEPEEAPKELAFSPIAEFSGGGAVAKDGYVLTPEIIKKLKPHEEAINKYFDLCISHLNSKRFNTTEEESCKKDFYNLLRGNKISASGVPDAKIHLRHMLTFHETNDTVRQDINKLGLSKIGLSYDEAVRGIVKRTRRGDIYNKIIKKWYPDAKIVFEGYDIVVSNLPGATTATESVLISATNYFLGE